MSEPLSMILTGDSIILRGLAMGEDDDARALAALIGDADAALTNLEVLPNGFRGHPDHQSGGTHMGSRASVLDELIALGFNLFPAATNHVMDYGIAGLLATMAALDARGARYAGIGRNLAEARMPAYLDTDRGSVALIACASTFGTGWQASDQRPDMPGRPGLNPLRATTTSDVTPDQLAMLREIAEGLGVEQRRQELIRLGFAFPPDDPEVFPFFGNRFRAAGRHGTTAEANPADADAIATWVREARGRADLVIVSLHAHEQGATKEDPAGFIQPFARRAIDAGAHVVVGHGPHLLRGMELYRGRPIFYSLGNFIAQDELIERFPSDAYARFQVAPAGTPHDITLARSGDDGRRGFGADARYCETIVPRLTWSGDTLAGIELAPVTLRQNDPFHRRGRPRLARGDEAESILDRFARLSAPFGVRLASRDGRATVDLSG